MRLIAIIFVVLSLFAAPAAAATSVFATGVYSQTGTTTNLPNGLGAPNGSAAGIGGGFSFFGLNFGFAGEAVYSFAAPLSGAGLQFSALAGTGAPQIFVSIGEIVSGVATFSAETSFTAGAGGLYSLDLSGACSGVSATGCSLLRVRNAGGFGGGAFLLDGVSGVAAAPEPAAWALMLLGFFGVAAQLKRRRQLNIKTSSAYA
ncbi:MAG: PEP-CTERM sorting domain-containing protein [Parvularculaceae bacterium]